MANFPEGIGLNEAFAAVNTLNRPAEEFVNDAGVETLWAMKAYEHAEIHYNILCSVDPQHLKLTPYDKKIYSQFKKKFPHFDITVLKEESLKSAEAKEAWRNFCNSFQNVEDFNFGTLVRVDATKDYSPENTILVTRIQFLAIEIARNKEGLNNGIRLKSNPS